MKVNRKPVRFRQRCTTGFEIKTASIEQDVPIEPDFAPFSYSAPVSRKSSVTRTA